MARFAINIKALKDLSSLVMLYKGKNKTLRNYRKRYWDLYNEIDEYLEELVVVSYKHRLTSGKKLWDNLTLDPIANI